MSKVNRKNYYIVLSLIVLCFSTKSFAEPQVASVNSANNIVDIFGSNFGAKATAAPVFFNTMESVALGALPDGFTINAGIGTPVATSPARGNSTKSMKFSADLTAFSGSSSEKWGRSVYDLGIGGADHVYITYWLNLDKTGTSCTSSPSNLCQWQWKNTYVGATPSAYTSTIPNNTTMGIDNWYRNSISSWFNTFALNYYNGLTNGGGVKPSIPSDAYVFNQWQRVEVYVQRSSAPLTPDGQFKIQRIGKAAMLNSSDIITNDSDDLPWRYIAIGQAITNVIETYVGKGGRVKWDAYYDDVYIDTTLARVEMCDTPVWADRTHCEIQPATSWADAQIKVSYNPGNFTTGQNVYVYVVDSNGLVNNTGSKFTVGASTPSAPKNVIKIPAK